MSVGPRKVCWPPLYPLISRTTSAARLVRSSTNPRTKNTGTVINPASAQTTMSFTPWTAVVKHRRIAHLPAFPKIELLYNTKYSATNRFVKRSYSVPLTLLW